MKTFKKVNKKRNLLRIPNIFAVVFSVALPTLSFSYPNIQLQLHSAKKLTPDTYKISIFISYIGSTSSNVLNHLGIIDREIRKIEKAYEKTESNFRIIRNCFYSSNRYVCEGYKGMLNYTFYMKTPKEQNLLFDRLNTLNNFGINYQVNNVSFVVSHQKVKLAKEKLIKDIAKESIFEAREFSKIFAKDCYVKNISYINNRPIVFPHPLVYALALAPKNMNRKPINTPIPTSLKQTISLSANINISCK